jgi:peroxisomal membrane protein 2
MTAQSRPVPIKEKSQSFPSYLLALYLQQLITNPLRTKAITSGILSGLQEFVAQELSGTNSRRKGKAKENGQNVLIDEKILKMALYGMLFLFN